jgi:hypothetical protein
MEFLLSGRGLHKLYASKAKKKHRGWAVALVAILLGDLMLFMSVVAGKAGAQLPHSKKNVPV